MQISLDSHKIEQACDEPTEWAHLECKIILLRSMSFHLFDLHSFEYLIISFMGCNPEYKAILPFNY